MDVQRALVDWFRKNGREFPWRETDDLFEVLVAELMLQRTTTTHVTKIYEDFVAEFPTPDAVLAADRDELMAYLETLGLQQQRYDALTSICRTLVDDYDGDVPRDPHELQSIDGIGEYIANATLCFGDGQRLPVIDSNVLRVYGRYFDVDDATARRKARSLLPEADYEDYNMALLDLGAVVCRPQYPKCDRCPLADGCLEGQSRLEET